ncbi:alkaline phosphatase PhoX [Pseudonocardia phyllosphaerae]|uniref:alkaline phosphatase PhoX n=1 Tax=Pseudonocardia phyllosphaerae TaxID=3390502 RepID=UPI00397DB06A
MTSLHDSHHAGTNHTDTDGLSRRSLLRASALAGLGIGLSGTVGTLASPEAFADPSPAAGYGPVVADPRKLLALPRGFRYTVVAEAGVTRLTDGGEPTPSDTDGTACFPGPRNGYTLVNNHEIGGDEPHRVPNRPGLTYDPAGGGGTTNVDVGRDGTRIGEYVSVAGTHNNCAGGVTPWGTWLSCEETEAKAGTSGLTKDHGFVFEVSPRGAENPGNSPVPLKMLGRFSHEAVAVDPRNHTIYLTEDAAGPNGLLYRWIPPKGFHGATWALKAIAEAPGGSTAGTFQAMRATCDGRHVRDLSEATKVGTTYRVEWSDVPDRLAASVSTRKQLPEDRITRSRKFEGAWWGDGGAYIVASYARLDDGSVHPHDGQIWFYDPAKQTITLKVIFPVNTTPDQDGSNYDGPDNITVSPYGGVVVAEDGEGVQHLLGVDGAGRPYTMARNDLNGSEFTGPNFSPDRAFLFAGIQSPGHVLAITGPWRSTRG